jgi:4-hydroxybenzoate polyprenyltransferase
MDMVIIWLKTFRWKNLLIALFLLLAFRLGVNEAFGFPSALPNWGFALAVISTLIIMAGGYLINDIYDRPADAVNRPDRMALFRKYEEDKLYNVVMSLFGIGVLTGGILAFYIDKWLYAAFPVFTVFLLYQYAHQLKRKPFIGNLTISFLAGLMIISLMAFDVIPALKTDLEVKENYQGIIYIYLVFAGFSFYTTLVREMLKDIEDMEGDRKAGYHTLPIVWSERSVRFVVFLLLMVFFIFFGLFTQRMIEEDNMVWTFLAGLVIFSGAAMWMVRPGSRKVNYRLAQNLVKALMVYGILLLPAFSVIG